MITLVETLLEGTSNTINARDAVSELLLMSNFHAHFYDKEKQINFEFRHI